MTLIQNIYDLLEDDDVNKATQSSIMIELYKAASDDKKDLIDNIFIALCGYDLAKLINECEGE